MPGLIKTVDNSKDIRVSTYVDKNTAKDLTQKIGNNSIAGYLRALIYKDLYGDKE